jgi:hypothetical protein
MLAAKSPHCDHHVISFDMFKHRTLQTRFGLDLKVGLTPGDGGSPPSHLFRPAGNDWNAIFLGTGTG